MTHFVAAVTTKGYTFIVQYLLLGGVATLYVDGFLQSFPRIQMNQYAGNCHLARVDERTVMVQVGTQKISNVFENMLIP